MKSTAKKKLIIFLDDEMEATSKTTRKPDISVGYILKQFDLTSKDGNTSQEQRSNSDFVVLTDKDEIDEKMKKRRPKSSDEIGKNERTSFFTMWSVSLIYVICLSSI